MQTNDTIKIISALAKGIDPQTGAELDANCPCRHPETANALNACVRRLQFTETETARKQHKKRSRPENAGKDWTNEEDARLRSAYIADKPIRQLAKDHKRTQGSIVGRLGLYGLVTPQPHARQSRPSKFPSGNEKS